MRQAYITVDLGFGDAGKGSIVDFLTRSEQAHTVVRYNGGAQAGHRVVSGGADPGEHVFAQFGSGTLAGAATHLSRFMLVEPLAMLEEARHLEHLGFEAFGQTTIDERALVITPFQRAINRLRELARGSGRHGSCGMGVGETMADYLQYGERVLFVGELARPQLLRTKLEFLRSANLAKVRDLPANVLASEQGVEELAPLVEDDWYDWLVDAYGGFARHAKIVPGRHLSTILQRSGTVVFEGAQGVLLDEWHGFHPHTTWSTTTLENADRLLREAGYYGDVIRIGITRAYATRHGAGPLVTEDMALTRALPDATNRAGAWQQGFRAGWLDLVMLRYAIEVTGELDMLAVTCLDRLSDLPEARVCRAYHQDSTTVERLVRSPVPRSLEYQEQLGHMLEASKPILEPVDARAMIDILAGLGVPVGIISMGPTAEDKQWQSAAIRV